jgi:hypothetical protein
MKKLFTLLLMLVSFVTMNATVKTATFDLTSPTTYGYKGGSTSTSTDGDITGPLVQDDVTMTVDNSTATGKARFWKGTSSVDFRIYKPATMTFAIAKGAISKIEFTGTLAATASPATLTDKTWAGSAQSVVFTNTGTSKLTKVVVTYDLDATAGGGTDPGETTYKVIDNIGALTALTPASDTIVKLTLKDAKVTAVKDTTEIFLEDATGAVEIYKTSLRLTRNSVLNGSMIVDFKLYNGTPEIVSNSLTNLDAVTVTTVSAIQPTKMTIEEAMAISTKNINKLVEIDNVKVKSGVLYDKDDNQLTVYDHFKSGYVLPDTVKSICGIIGYFAKSKINELYPRDVNDIVAATAPVEPAAANTIADFKKLAKDAVAKLMLKDAQVIYVNGTTDAYVQDATGAIDLYKSGLTLKQNQVLNGFVYVKSSPYNGLPEAVAITGDFATSNSTFTAAEGSAVVPVEVASGSWLNADNYCRLVKISSFASYNSTTGGIKDANGDSVTIYNKFKLTYTLPATLVSVTGIFAPYITSTKTTYSIYPIDANAVVTSINDINVDVNAPKQYFTVDGRQVAAPEKGLYILRQGKSVKKIIK